MLSLLRRGRLHVFWVGDTKNISLTSFSFRFHLGLSSAILKNYSGSGFHVNGIEQARFALTKQLCKFD
jgi:hypothetical protein